MFLSSRDDLFHKLIVLKSTNKKRPLLLVPYANIRGVFGRTRVQSSCFHLSLDCVAWPMGIVSEEQTLNAKRLSHSHVYHTGLSALAQPSKVYSSAGLTMQMDLQGTITIFLHVAGGQTPSVRRHNWLSKTLTFA